MRLWHLRDLFTDHQTGKLRETSLWSNIGKFAMTFSFIFLTIKGSLTEWYVAAYGGVVVLHEMGAKYLNQRQQQVDKQPNGS